MEVIIKIFNFIKIPFKSIVRGLGFTSIFLTKSLQIVLGQISKVATLAHKTYKRYKTEINFILSLIAAILIIANLQKYQYISSQWLKDQKDALAALNSIITMIVIVAGAIFSYYRFFFGRTFALRTELSLDVSVHGTNESFTLHAINLNVKNIGGLSLWNPKARLTLVIHGETEVKREISDWQEDHFSADQDRSAISTVIESGETTSFFTYERIPENAWAVTYVACLTVDQASWKVSKTVTNKGTN